MTPSVNILAERERHLLSNHADIEATKNNAIEHFLYVESFRDEQKICLNLVRRGHDVFAILPTGSGRESLIFLTLSTKNERTERKSWPVKIFVCLFLFVLFCFFFQFNSILYFTLYKIFTQVSVGRKIK